MTKLGRKRTRFTRELRYYHVNQLLKLDLSVLEYCRQFGLSTTSMYRWLDQFSKPVEMEEHQQKNATNLEESKQSRINALEEEVARLKTQLHDEQLKRLGYEKMIQIAEKTFKISIEKKSGTKQLKR